MASAKPADHLSVGPAQASTTSGHELSRFELLPAEIRRQIYEDLLCADNVRQKPDGNMICSYRFETAILAVNRRIHNDTWPILYRENYFVQVSCNWEYIFEAMEADQVAGMACSRPKAVARFKQHVLRLHIVVPWAKSQERKHVDRKKGKVLESFLLVANELPRFARMLSNQNTVFSACSYTLKFRLETPLTGSAPSLTIQKRILEPFRNLTVVPARLFINGAIAAAYATELRECISSTVRWTRAVKWQIYDYMVSKIAVGDKAFRLACTWSGQLRLDYLKTASFQYQQCQHWLPHAEDNNPRLYSSDVDGYCDMANYSLVELKTQHWDEILGSLNLDMIAASLPHIFRSSPLPTQILIHQLRGIAFGELGHLVEAREELDKALRLDGNDPRTTSLVKTYALPAPGPAEASEILSRDTINSFNEPQLPPSPIRKGSSIIANERQVLTHFGYKGSLLPEIVAGEPVQKELVRQFIEVLEYELRAEGTVGQGVGMLWVQEFGSF